MKQITIKAYSACEAVRFFNLVNPFMFWNVDLSSRLRNHPEWHFMDPITGESKEAQVEIPDECEFIHDLGDLPPRCFPDRLRYRGDSGLRLDYPGASLVLEYAIVDGVKIPTEDGCCCCP